MNDQNLPVDPADRGAALPARSETLPARTAAASQLSIDLLDERRGDDSDEIDLLAYWRILVKRRWLILSILAGIVALALLATLLATPIYRATAVLQLDQDTQQVVQVQGIDPDSGRAVDPNFLQTQYELLKSRSLAERVANQLNITAADLDRFSAQGFIGRMLGLLHPQARSKGVSPDTTANASPEVLRKSADLVENAINIEPVRNSRLVKVNFDSASPQFAARAANAVADGFIASGLERRFGASSYAKTYLDSQLKLTKARLEDSERQLVAYAQKENIINSGDSGQSLATQSVTQLNAQLADAQNARIKAEALWNQAASGGALPSDMVANSNIRPLQQQKAAIQAPTSRSWPPSSRTTRTCCSSRARSTS